MTANYKTLEYDLERFLAVINKHACKHETARDGKMWEFFNIFPMLLRYGGSPNGGSSKNHQRSHPEEDSVSVSDLWGNYGVSASRGMVPEGRQSL